MVQYLPPGFIKRTQSMLKDEFVLLEQALQQEASVSIRINERKLPVCLPYARIPWCGNGYYLPGRIPFTFDPLFHAGGYYVQEASSMFLEQAVGQYVASPVTCLDLCAAPGGKSTLLSSILPKGSLLVANEVIRSRSQTLAENMMKWGSPNVVVTNNDPSEIGRLTHLFDLIVADLPCSGEGMFRKDPGSIDEWSAANVELCAARQRRIAGDCWDALKPGGLLIYSTCTYNTEENEENIQYLAGNFGAEALPVATAEEWNISGAMEYTRPAYRFFPHKTKGEGFFLAVLRKPGSNPPSTILPLQKRQKTSPAPQAVKEWIASADDFCFEMKGNEIIAVPAAHQAVFRYLNGRLRIVSAGVTAGELKGKDIIPSQSLALSLSCQKESFPQIHLDWEQAIRYLRKEAIQSLPENTPKGYLLATYKGLALGFLKNIGNRANNLYPQEGRIRSAHIPGKAVDILSACYP